MIKATRIISPSSTLNCGSLWCIYVSMHFFTLTPQTLPRGMCLQMQRLQIQTDLQVCICSLKVCRHTLLNSLGIFNCSMLFNLPLTNCLKPRLSHWFLILVVYVFTGCQPRGSEGGLQSTLDENHHHLCVCVHARVHMYFLKVILKDVHCFSALLYVDSNVCVRACACVWVCLSVMRQRCVCVFSPCSCTPKEGYDVM